MYIKKVASVRATIIFFNSTFNITVVLLNGYTLLIATMAITLRAIGRVISLRFSLEWFERILAG